MILEENTTKISIPKETVHGGPGTIGAGFYNPDQILNRDVTVALLSVLKPRLYLDGFGGTGIRGIRVTKELGIHSVISEISKKSFDIIRENTAMNAVDVELFNEPFESIASKYIFDFIDVDPYGSIVPFLDVALQHIRNGGYLGLTATDLSALTGSAAQKTRRRYGAHIQNDRLRHESGIRLLTGYVALRAAALDCGITPVMSFWKSHYYRLVVKVRRGASEGDHAISQVRKVNKNRELHTIYPEVDEGPIWTGLLESLPEIRGAMQHRPLAAESEATEIFKKSLSEDDMLYFYELTDFASKFSLNLPKIDRMVEAIEIETGVKAHRTHFSATGIKAAMEPAVFTDLFRTTSRT